MTRPGTPLADCTVTAYRLIPRRIRRALLGWRYPTPTSHLYVPGDGWARLWSLVGDSKPPRPPMP